MTKTETIKIMAMLSAYYGQGKSNAEIMANAWHLLLKDYPYNVVEQAVLTFARTDRRDYASFPAPALIIKVIEETQAERKALVSRTFNAMLNGRPYDDLTAEQRDMCHRELYEQGLKTDYEELIATQDAWKDAIRNKRKAIIRPKEVNQLDKPVDNKLNDLNKRIDKAVSLDD